MIGSFKICHRISCLLVLALGFPTSAALAEERFLIEGLFDLETYKTDPESKYLARNDGETTSQARLKIWSAYQLTSKLQIYALGEFEIEELEGERETEKEIEQFALRYSTNTALNISVEAGKILSPIGAFAARRLSTLNPLIGAPIIYDTGYPLGIVVAGSSDRFDFRDQRTTGRRGCS